MTRTQTAAVSLVAAIPAGILAALLAMAFLNHAENLRLMTQVLVGATLLLTVVVALMPFAVLVFGGKKKAAAAATGKKGAKAAAGDDDAEMTSGEYAADPEADEDTETVVFDGEASQLTDEVDESDYLDTEDLGDDDMLLSDDEILIDEEEDEPPAKKKKKK